jgi:hypothetical protein
MADAELHGLLAEFEGAEALRQAVVRMRTAGYRRMDAFSPYAVDGMGRALGLGWNWVPWMALAGGAGGVAIGYGLQYYLSVIDYPLNIGGRPLHSWPAFLPIAFETAILGAALAAVAGLLLFSGLPRLHHPVFNAPDFRRATQNGFFLLIEAADSRFDRQRTRRLLQAYGAQQVTDVEA